VGKIISWVCRFTLCARGHTCRLRGCQCACHEK